MSFTPGLPPGMDPNAGMNEQEKQMVKYMQMGMESCVGKATMSTVMGGGLGLVFGLFMASMRYDTPMSGPPVVNTVPVPKGTPTNVPAASAASAAKTGTGATTQAIKAATTTIAGSTPPTHTPTSKPASALSSAAKPAAPSTAANLASAATTTTTATITNVPISDLPLRQQLKHGLQDMYKASISSGRNFAKVGGIFAGTECAIEGLRGKNDLWNGVAGGCLTGGILARNAGPQAAAVGCAGFAVFSAAIDAYMRMPEDERSRPIG